MVVTKHALLKLDGGVIRFLSKTVLERVWLYLRSVAAFVGHLTGGTELDVLLAQRRLASCGGPTPKVTSLGSRPAEAHCSLRIRSLGVLKRCFSLQKRELRSRTPKTVLGTRSTPEIQPQLLGPRKLLVAVWVCILSFAAIAPLAATSDATEDPVYPCNTNIQTAIGVGDITATVVDRYGQLRRAEWSIQMSVGEAKRPVTGWLPSQSLARGYLPIVRTQFPPEAGELSLLCFSSDRGGGAADYLRVKAGNQRVHLLLTPTAGQPQVKDGAITVDDQLLAVFTPPQKIEVVKPKEGLICEGTTGLAGWGTPRIPCDLAFRNIRVGWEGRTIRYVFPADSEKPSHVYLGFIESYWAEPRKRVLDITVNGQKKTLDPIEDTAKDQPIILDFIVEKAGEIVIEVVAAAESQDKNSTLAAIWIFDEKVDTRELLLGRMKSKARGYVDCGSRTEKVARSGVVITCDKGTEAWLRLPIPGQPTGEEKIGPSVGKAALCAAEEKWEAFLSKGSKIILPDEKLNNLYKTSLINLVLLRLHLPQESPEEDIYVVRPGVTVYADFWYRDGAYLCRAFDVAGYPEEAEKSLRLFWRSRRLLKGNNAWLQAPNGCWNYPLNEWDGQGQAPWALMSHYRFTRDKAWLEKVYPSLRAGGHWMRASIQKTKWSKETPRPITWGLFPVGHGEAIGEGYIYYHNFWGVFGMKEIAEAARVLGKKKDLEWMEVVYKQFREDMLRSVKIAFETTGKGAYIPGDPFSSRLRIWGSLAALYPCRILEPDDPMITATLDSMWQRMEEASPGEDEYVFVTNPKLWTYITTDWAQCYLLRGDLEKFWRLFNGYVRHASPTNAWIEEIFLDSRTGTGDMPHGWAAADYILLVRNSIVLEKQNTLHIATGVQSRSLMKGSIEVRDLPTEFGRADLTVSRQGKSKPLSVALKIRKFADVPARVPVTIHVPSKGDWDSQTVLVNGELLPVTGGVAKCEL